MNDMPKQETTQTAFVPGWEFAKAGSDAAQQFCNQGQVVAKALTDWTSEYSRFINQRISRTSECVAQMGKCQSLPDMLMLQTQWLQSTVNDYVEETGKLMEVNSKIF